MIRPLSLSLSLAITLLGAPAFADAQWTVDPDFEGKSAREEISGAACDPLSNAQDCLAVDDETRSAHRFSWREGQITPGPRLRLIDTDDEIDAEAVTYADGKFYLTGSHGLSRKKGRFRPAQFLVFRIDGGTVTRSDRLRDLIRTAPGLGRYAEQRLNKNGANIEGLAAQNGRLYFGFRGPSVQGTGFALEVPTNALFSDAPLHAQTHTIPLASRIGIRDMAPVQDGILLLTGPVNTLPRIYRVALWTPGCGAPIPLAQVPEPADGKPEGLLVLSETDSAYRVLIFHDGARNGAPAPLSFPKPTPK